VLNSILILPFPGKIEMKDRILKYQPAAALSPNMMKAIPDNLMNDVRVICVIHN
jgi:hypothetical protein